MRVMIYLSAVIVIIAAVAVNAVITVKFNVARIYVTWEEKRAEYENCFNACKEAGTQIEAVCNRWGKEPFVVEKVCANSESRSDIPGTENPFVNAIREKLLLLYKREEDVSVKLLSI